ncbi:MAG: phospho-N-acetylmuramoyl-pentapeptide-transferase, partial [Bacteroidota bacterium]
MLFHFLYNLSPDFAFFNLFRYITFRTFGSITTALLISFFLGPKFIRWLRSYQKHGQPIREDGPESHLITKKGTPTMGGVLILFSLVTSCLLWGVLTDAYLWIVLLVTLGFGLLGAFDDYMKLRKRSSKGLSGKSKLFLQIVIGATASV